MVFGPVNEHREPSRIGRTTFCYVQLAATTPIVFLRVFLPANHVFPKTQQSQVFLSSRGSWDKLESAEFSEQDIGL
ncbi:hypothetical protein CPC08DRAFT_322701 [Agrocybe pediades]|nr:hypothetical protein CPC08DRAFT_322701 [Agrocybe pediades]